MNPCSGSYSLSIKEDSFVIEDEYKELALISIPDLTLPSLIPG